MTFVEALRAFKAVTGKLPLDITMMIEGEEECGSKSLFDFVADNADEFKRDLALVCDTGMWDPEDAAGDDLAARAGLRGGDGHLRRPRSAFRPVRRRRRKIRSACSSRILAAMHDENGRVTIPGFYDGVPELPADIKADLKALNLTPEEFLGQVGLKVPAGEKDRMLIEQISTRPTCDVNGIIGGYTGEGAKTVIAAAGDRRRSRSAWSATQNPEKIRDSFRAFVRERLPADAKVEFINHACSPALQLAYDNPALVKARAALTEEWGNKAVTVGAGGSIPIVGDFKRVLGMDTIMVGFCARRRPRAFAEREIRPHLVPQGHALLGAHPGGAGGVKS